MHHISVIPSSVEGHLSCFYFLAIVNRVTMKKLGQVSVEQDVKSFGHRSRVVIHTYSFSYSGSHSEFQASLSHTVRPCLQKKLKR